MQDSNVGQGILDVVFKHLNLLETAYFGLRYLDPDGQTHWLDPAKKLSRQLKDADPCTLYFGVKFYAADPCKLLEEITRYQFFLQVKQDILQARLPVSFELAAELGAYIVQSELGDYDPRRHSPGYVSEFRFLSNQTLELETRIAELHKTLVGQLPSVAELNYLDKVKWLEMYGVDLHPVLGEDNVEYFLGLTPSGIIVLRNKNTVGNYYWPRISKIYFKGRYFMLRVTDKNNDESTYGFETPSKAACKHLWKCCVEHHAFFRLVQVSPTTPDIFALGSRFRYSGRTEKQAVRDAQLRARTPPSFTRTPSRRYQRRIVEGANDVQLVDESTKADHFQQQEVKHISIPQPAQSFESPYQATCTSAVKGKRSDSPHSTRSAPWSQPHSRGLYNSSVPPSPRSVRSAGPRYRSSSIDSQSSNESRSCKRRKHRSRMTSDNESELSKCSGRSHRKHRRHRSRGNKRDSGSEQDSHSHRHKSLSKSRGSDSHYELVDSGSQWREIQKRQAGEGNASSIQQANVISSKRSGYVNSGLETESELSYRNRNRRHRRHRSRSRSPSEGKNWLSDEVKKHLEFDLIDTVGMSDSQLREIPYTVVQTNHAKQLKIKQWNKPDIAQGDKISRSPPPPYSSHIADANRVRGIHVTHNLKNESPSQLSYNNDFTTKTASSNLFSSNNNSNSMLPRMLDSLGISDNFSCNSSQRSNKNVRIGNSALYGNPNTLLGGLSNGFHEGIESPRVSHEHTDSGLGAEQDCPYSSERSSDSMKFGSTNSKILGGSEARAGSISVSKVLNSEYQALNPHQLYPTHNSQPACRAEPPHVNKSNVHMQDMECKYGLSKASPRISYNMYNASNMQFHTGSKNNTAYKQSADLRTSFVRMGSKHSNASYSDNSHLTHHNISSSRSSLRSITSSPMANDNDSGPLRLQYRMGSSIRSKSSTVSGGNHELDNFIYSYQRADTNQNISQFPVPASVNQSNSSPNEEHLANRDALNLLNNSACNGNQNSTKTRDSAEMSTEL
ncbi:hypothetical protein ILUMI_07413 [Ignelater luminosus]|uniref:FERM domain-containing protein n=1 Tax=Ignelater luminosus TaxID=2038154 RepID=A0A8K0D3L4_IGNLU|nr:hypothetical protein ILUMI_07413 [Ignelater luminosus]